MRRPFQSSHARTVHLRWIRAAAVVVAALSTAHCASAPSSEPPVGEAPSRVDAPAPDSDEATLAAEAAAVAPSADAGSREDAPDSDEAALAAGETAPETPAIAPEAATDQGRDLRASATRPMKAAPSGGALRMLHLSDVHLDPFFESPNCKALLGELWDSGTGSWIAGEGWDAVFENLCDPHGGAAGTLNDPSDPQCTYTRASSSRDTNWRIFDSSVGYAASILDPTVRYAVVTGDFVAHDFRGRYCPCAPAEVAGLGDACATTPPAAAETAFDDFMVQTLAFVGSKIGRELDLPIFATLGNNDAFCGDYRILPGSGYLDAAAEIWNRWFAPFDAGEATRFAEGGFYGATLPSGHRVLSINTTIYTTAAMGESSYHPILCNLPDADQDGFDSTTIDLSSAAWSGLDLAGIVAKLASTTDARGNALIDTQFGWMVGELAKAAAGSARVWIVAHVPPGVNGFDSVTPGQPSYYMADAAAHDFATLLADSRLSGAVAGFLAGHSHESELKVSRLAAADPPAGMVVMGPAIDSDHGNNPGFQRYDLDPATLEITESWAYWLDDDDHWGPLASFNRSFGPALGDLAPGLTPESVAALFDAMLTNEAASRDRYGCFYNSDAFTAAGNDCGLPDWCQTTAGSGAAYQTSVADLIGDFAPSCAVPAGGGK